VHLCDLFSDATAPLLFSAAYCKEVIQSTVDVHVYMNSLQVEAVSNEYY